MSDDPVVALCETSVDATETWKIEGAAIREQKMARALLVIWEANRRRGCVSALCKTSWPSVVNAPYCETCALEREVLRIVEGRDG